MRVIVPESWGGGQCPRGQCSVLLMDASAARTPSPPSPFPEGGLKEGSLSSKCPVMGWDGVRERALVETFCCPRGFAGPLPAPALGPT